jgi:phage repressor protein C with HTH and peptisase S24 domain
MDRQELKRVLEEIGRGAQTRLGEYLGLEGPTMSKLVNGPRVISANEAVRIRIWLAQYGKEVGDGIGNDAVTNTSVGSPTGTVAPGRQDDASSSPSSHQADIEDRPPSNARMARPEQMPRMPLRTEMARDVPIMGTVLGGSVGGDAEFQLNGQIVDYARRPPRIAGRKDVFAAYVQGTSMSPWREPGKLIYVESARPPAVNDYVLVEFKPTNGDEVRGALVKQYKGATSTKYKLYQHNPAKAIEIDRRDVLRVYRVMDWDELLGV